MAGLVTRQNTDKTGEKDYIGTDATTFVDN